MVRLALKTMCVKNPHFAEGVLINQDMFDPQQHVAMTDEKPTRKPGRPARTNRQEEE